MAIWDAYSLFYNSLKNLLPYQELVADVKSSLGIDSKGFYLDLGCGTGNLMENHRNIVGFDISVGMLQVARQHNPCSMFICGDLNAKLPFQSKQFDGALSCNVLAYLKSPKDVLLEVSRVLKPGAIFVLATLRPSFNPRLILIDHLKRSSWSDFFKYFLLIVIILLINRSIVKRLQMGIYHGFEIDDLDVICRDAQFEVVKSKLAYALQDVFFVLRRV